MSELRLAFLGCGFATTLHSRTLRRFPKIRRLYASRDAGRAERFSRRFGGVAHFGSYEAALTDPSVDMVLVATPPSSHLELARAALDAGKHVIVEKPPFLRTTDFDDIALSAAAADRRVFVAENYFYKPLLRELRRLIAERVIGDIRILTINALKQQRTENWRDHHELAGGGAFFEGGIHWVNFMTNLGLAVSDVHGYRPGARTGLDKTMIAVFEYAEGPVGTLFYSWEIGSPLKGLRLSSIYGTEGAITFESNGLFVAVRGRRKRVSIPRPRDLLGYSAMFEDFFAALRTGRPAEFELAAARRDLDLVERIYRTAGTTVPTPNSG